MRRFLFNPNHPGGIIEPAAQLAQQQRQNGIINNKQTTFDRRNLKGIRPQIFEGDKFTFGCYERDLNNITV